MNEASFYIIRLLNYYNVGNIVQLSPIINVSQQAVTNWKSRNSVASVIKKCQELGIYDEIFGVEFEPDAFKIKDRTLIENEIECIFEKLFAYFQVDSISSLARAINTPQSTIQKWKDRQSKSAIEKFCRRLDIYHDIFTDKNDYKGSNNIRSINKTVNPLFDNFDQDIINLFESVYIKLEKENNLKKLFDSLSELKFQ